MNTALADRDDAVSDHHQIMVRVGQYFRMSRIENPLSSEAVLENMHLLTQATVKKILHDPECQEALASADITQKRYLDLVPAEIVQRYLPKRNPLASAYVNSTDPSSSPRNQRSSSWPSRTGTRSYCTN